MDQKARYQAFFSYLSTVPAPIQTELVYDTPFQLLIAVILSAQCTDIRVNACTPMLFSAFPTAESLSKASFDEVFSCIKSITYPKSKTKYVVSTAKQLVKEFDGQLPTSIDALQRLPGVGRKTAHVVASILYDEAVIAVDTHVFRVAKRVGFVSDRLKTPLMVEKELMTQLPVQYIQIANRWMLLHGRYICKARKPKCHICAIIDWCNYFQNN